MATTLVLLATLSLLFVAVGGVVTGGSFAGMTLAFALALLLNLVAYAYSDRFVLRLYHAQPLHDPELDRMAAEIAKEAKLPKPKLYRVPLESPNAFATGRNLKHAAVAVTDGLLKLEPAEVRAVLGHEIGHIKNRDMLVASMAGVLAGAIGYIAQIGYWSMLSRDNRNNPLGILLIVICAPIAALLVRMAISRHREYAADTTGSRLTKNPEALASALRKIDKLSKPIHGPASTGHLWISNPFGDDWFSQLFRTHPPIPKRVERLERMKV